jgi:hypothetical protein
MKDHHMARPTDGDRDAESRRILDRVERDSHRSRSGIFGGATDWARVHIAADDADPNDWVEVWGTRIGRSIGLVIVVAFLVWVLYSLLAGA